MEKVGAVDNAQCVESQIASEPLRSGQIVETLLTVMRKVIGMAASMQAPS